MLLSHLESPVNKGGCSILFSKYQNDSFTCRHIFQCVRRKNKETACCNKIDMEHQCCSRKFDSKFFLSSARPVSCSILYITKYIEDRG